MQTIQTAFTLGKTALPCTAILAPMAGVADRAYRLLCRSFGAAATVSEMVSVKGLCYGDKGSAELCTITEPERPMGLQLFGSEPEFVGKAAALVQQYEPDWIDINMGCPVHKVVATGAGSALMRNIPLAQEIVRAAVRGEQRTGHSQVPAGLGREQHQRRPLCTGNKLPVPPQLPYTAEPNPSCTAAKPTGTPFGKSSRQCPFPSSATAMCRLRRTALHCMSRPAVIWSWQDGAPMGIRFCFGRFRRQCPANRQCRLRWKNAWKPCSGMCG